MAKKTAKRSSTHPTTQPSKSARPTPSPSRTPAPAPVKSHVAAKTKPSAKAPKLKPSATIPTAAKSPIAEPGSVATSELETVKVIPIKPRAAFQPAAWIAEALKEARLGLAEGGIPIGAVLVDAAGTIISRGHNLRVQTGDPTAHAEMVCYRNAGRRLDWNQLTLVTTLSPCIMCSGATLLFGVRRVVIGENRNYLGAENLLRQHGVGLTLVNDARCIEVLAEFIKAFPEVWNEDIGIPPASADAK